MHTFYSYSYSVDAVQQCNIAANILDIVQYIELHPLFSTKAFFEKLFKNFEKQV